MPRARWRRIGLAAFAAFLAGATARGFDGETGAPPTPPRQAEPWIPPATRLPRFLVSATAALFEQGLGDPRGCEYRSIEIDIIKVWVAGGQPASTRTHGWVLPRAKDATEDFAVCWNGLVYPVAKLGDKADLDADIRASVESVKASRARVARSATRRPLGGFALGTPAGAIGVEQPSPMKICLLLRLGRADFAESLFAATTVWTPEVTGRDLTDYGISYLTLASDWAWSLFDRALEAHGRGDDRIALADSRLLAEASKKIEAKAAAMGFPRPDPRNQISPPNHPFLGFLAQLEALHRDQERRAREPRREAPPPESPPAVRIAALIRDLDEIRGDRAAFLGGPGPFNSDVVRKLIAEGENAVEPLLAVLESDTRLTRSIAYGRSMSDRHRNIHGVQMFAYTALAEILQTRNFGGDQQHQFGLLDASPERGKTLATAIRAYWEKNRGIPPDERWFRVLADDAASPGQWEEAASHLVSQPALGPAAQKPGGAVTPNSGTQPDPHRPSTSELIARRAMEMAQPDSKPRPGGGLPLNSACNLALSLLRLDPQRAQPVLATLMTRCLDELAGKSTGRVHTPRQSLIGFLSRLADARAASGDLAALDPFAEIIRGLTPQDLHGPMVSLLDLMAHYPKHPAIASAADWLFNDAASPWLADQRRSHFQMLGTPWYLKPEMLNVTGFRKRLLILLDDTTELGTVTVRETKNTKNRVITWKDQEPRGRAMVKTDSSGSDSASETSFRVCDYIAWQFSLHRVAGMPPFQLEWPQPRRDEALEACRETLKRLAP
jgi:hypothetical protein